MLKLVTNITLCIEAAAHLPPAPVEAEADDEDAADAAEDALEHGEGAAEVGAAHLHREDGGGHDPVTDPHQDPDTYHHQTCKQCFHTKNRGSNYFGLLLRFSGFNSSFL